MTFGACSVEMLPFLEMRDHNRGASRETFRYERCSRCG